MAENSKIEWCDHTFNPWIGCTKVGPGCDHCYAEAMMDTRLGTVNWGAGNPRKRTSEANWKLPLKWNDLAGKGLFVQCSECGKREFRKWDYTLPPGGLSCCSNKDCLALPESDSDRVRPRIFCASLADVFDNEVPHTWRQDLFNLIGQTPHLDWLLLTKRIGNVSKLMAGKRMPSNVWLGATIVNQEEADRDIPKLLDIHAKVRFLSMEPLLGPVDIDDYLNYCGCGNCDYCMEITSEPPASWVIVGGESGRSARPMQAEWVRSLRDQCAAAGVPFLFKQWGEYVPGELTNEDDEAPWREYQNGERNWSLREAILPREELPVTDYWKAGKKLTGRTLDGVTHTEFPVNL